jgi:hypothetical protein
MIGILEAGVQELEGHLALQLEIHGQDHLSEATFAKETKGLITLG